MPSTSVIVPSMNTITLMVRVGGYHRVTCEGIALSEIPVIAKAVTMSTTPIPAMTQFSSNADPEFNTTGIPQS